MKITCNHGYFIFEETQSGQISDFMGLYDVEIERSGDHFTFKDLIDAPDFVLAGTTYLGTLATVTYEGKPWEIMRANGLVYNFNRRLLVPIESVSQTIELQAAGNYYVSSGMIIPGSVTDDGLRVTDYSAFFLFSRLSFRYTEVDGE